MSELTPVFTLSYKVAYYITPGAENPLPIWRSSNITLARITKKFCFPHEELRMLQGMLAAQEWTKNCHIIRGTFEHLIDRIEIVGIIPLAD